MDLTETSIINNSPNSLYVVILILLQSIDFLISFLKIDKFIILFIFVAIMRIHSSIIMRLLEVLRPFYLTKCTFNYRFK